METTDAEKTRVQIIPLTGPAHEMYTHYPNQTQRQDCYIALDLRDGTMWASYNAEIGNAVPADVYHGTVRRYPIPPLQPKTVNKLMEEIETYAQIVLDHSEIVWDGHNHVAKLRKAARVAEEVICGDGNGYASDEYTWVDGNGDTGIIYPGMESDVYVENAGDWLDFDDVKDRLRAGETVEQLAEDYQGAGDSEDYPYLLDLEECVETLKSQLEDED